MKSKKNAQLIDTEGRMVVTRCFGWMGGGRVRGFSYKMNKSGDLMYSMVAIVNNTVLCTCNLLRD